MGATEQEVPDPDRPPGTLGEVLYANSSGPVASEAEWVALVRSAAAGDQRALQALYERANRPVFTLAMRITANRETAEEVTLDVFYDVWRRASSYQEANGTVLGWIMNQARSRAIDRLRFEQRKKRVPCEAPASVPAVPDPMSMLVRLNPGVDYPPHTHAGVEELFLLDGELWIEDRKLFPGDYNRAEPGTSDKRVWSETGCTCVLITSTRDILRS